MTAKRQTDASEKYVQLATKLFAENGFSGTSLASLAEQAGVSKQALLHFFGSKAKLYAIVLETLAARLMSAVERAQGVDPMVSLRVYLRLFCEECLANPQDAKLVIRALLDSDPKAKVWPLKPYVQSLSQMVVETPTGRTMSAEQARAYVFQIIGAIQYLAITDTAESAMFGPSDHSACRTSATAFIDQMLTNLDA